MSIFRLSAFTKIVFSLGLLAVAALMLAPMFPAVGHASTTCSEDSDCDDDEYCSQWGVCEPSNPFGGSGSGEDCTESCAVGCHKWIRNNIFLGVICSVVCTLVC